MTVLALPVAEGAYDPTPAPAGPPEYVLTLPVPGPEGPGQYVFLTVTPDGRTAAVLADAVDIQERAVAVKRDGLLVAMIPKEAPWMLIRRDLMVHQSAAEARAKSASRFRDLSALFGGAGGGSVCPVHGVDHDVPMTDGGSPESREPGQYL